MKIHNEVKSIGLRCVVPIASCLISSCMFGCHPPESSPDSASLPPLNVDVIEISEHQGVYDSKLYFGTLKPRRSSHLGFARGGRVESVLASVGDIASKDDEIALLEHSQLDDELASITETVENAQRELTSLQGSSNNLRQQAVNELQQKLVELQRQQREIQSAIDNGRIVAPYDCVIAQRNVHEGDTVSVGRPVLKVDERAPPIIEVNVAETISDRLQKGQRVWVSKDGSRIEASVESKAPEIDAAARTQAVVLSVTTVGSNIGWKFGEVVEVRFWIPTNQSGFWLPYSALQREASGLWSAYVVVGDGEDQVVSRRTLELIHIDEEIVLARGSLRAGDRLIVDGSNRIVPGQRVTSTIVAREFQIPGPPGAGG